MPAVGSDVVVIGAGVVGAACAYHAARAGFGVTVVERRTVAGGTSGSGEGNVLVSDHAPGPELDLALLSIRVWAGLAAELAEKLGEEGGFEYDQKGGLTVAADGESYEALANFAEGQRAAGVRAEPVEAGRLHDYEPHLAPGLAGGMYYPQDAQVQPMLAAARMLQAARLLGARVRTGVTVTGIDRDRAGRVSGVHTDAGAIPADAVVNAAGTWGGDVARLAGASLPIEPRRGFVLVTEPLPRVIHHKVYAASYISDVASESAALQSSPVIESTQSGTVLIGSSRERVGYDRTLSIPALRRIAAQAVALFPFLAEVAALRTYRGFRPYCADHLPVIGPDPRVPGLVHACGHEGAGIGLGAATGHLVGQVLAGKEPDLDLTPLLPDRFVEAA